MNSSNQSSVDSNVNEVNDENEISLIDIVNFFSDNWKKMIVAGIVGAIIAGLYWFSLVNYAAEKIIINNGVFNVISFKAMQKELPQLAAQIVDEKKVPKGLDSQYVKMENFSFWQKNLKPNYALTKQESKEFTNLSKELDVESTRITSLNLYAQARSKGQALENQQVYEDFIRSGGSYIQLKNLINNYENEYASKIIETEKDINSTKIELNYQKKQAKNLEELLKRFPNNPGASSQVVDPKDSGAKYLPLTTQIIATNTDINNNNEKLERLADKQLRLKIINQVLEKTNPLMDSTFDGMELCKKIKTVIDEIQKVIPPEDIKTQQQLLVLKANINDIQNRFDQGLYSSLAPSVSKKGMLKTPFIGFALAFFGMLVCLVFRKALANLKNNQSAVKSV